MVNMEGIQQNPLFDLIRSSRSHQGMIYYHFGRVGLYHLQIKLFMKMFNNT